MNGIGVEDKCVKMSRVVEMETRRKGERRKERDSG